MKQSKRKEIIESAIKLFAKNGFHSTSVQNIVDDCDMSKGAFYNYFTSKESLHLAIFKYYFDEMQRKMNRINRKKLEPRENFMRQMIVPFEEMEKYRPYIVMYMREQSFSINKELQDYLQQVQIEMITWYKELLQKLYGIKVQPYTGDLILIIEGIRNSYLTVMLFLDSNIDLDRFAKFLLNRVDDAVQAFLSGEEPVIQGELLANGLITKETNIIGAEDRVRALLMDMLDQLESIELETKQKEGFIRVIQIIQAELEKEAFDPYICQGMLANLKEVKIFDLYREKIAALLKIELL